MIKAMRTHAKEHGWPEDDEQVTDALFDFLTQIRAGKITY
jgi:hypothetical protein